MKALFAEYLVWDTPFRVGSHHYAGHFLDRGWEVGWLGGEFHPLNLLNNRPELARKFPIWRRGGVRHAQGLWEYTPLKLLPYRRWGLLGRESLAWRGDRFTLPSVRRVLARAGFDRADLLWLTNIQAYPWLAREEGYGSIVYRAADDQAAFASSPSSLGAIEEAVVRRAGAVFAASHAVYRRLRRMRQEGVYHLPNGVDLARFEAIQPPPPEYAGLPGRIAVYVGAIHYWFDVELLTDVARRRDDVSFVLIGQAHVPLTSLTRRPNVRFLGTRPPERIASYLQHAHVGLIPFVKSPLTDSINPLKMYEYLACGLPVVSSDLAEIRAMEAPLHLACDAEGFCRALEIALSITEADREAYRSYAAQHTWQARYARVDAVVDRLLA